MTSYGNNRRLLRLVSDTALRRRSGQAIIFIICVVVILFFVVLWNYDLHKILRTKYISRNGGDAAALMASRWQGITLNMIGDLNLMHALALTVRDYESADAAVAAQARLCFVGPMVAFAASQQAAKNNGLFQNDRYSSFIRGQAEVVRRVYPRIFSEPYPNCWAEYANMLDWVANNGVAAGPDNATFYDDYVGGHYLLTIGFYEAIATANWCWFYHNAPTLLSDYENFFPCWWAPLPPARRITYGNSEIYGLGLVRVYSSITNRAILDRMDDLAEERGLGSTISPSAVSTSATWYCYGSRTWRSWSAFSPTNSDPFPATGTLRPEYDYAGADAVVRVEARASRLTPGRGGAGLTDTITWTAAAKPFGYLEDRELLTSCPLVLPAFHDVRLIPVDASSAPSGGSFNLDWRTHIEHHLPLYMVNGPLHNGCAYCRQLVTWEDPSFRQAGVDWLSTNSALCNVTVGGGGGGGGGGSRIGH